MKKTDEDYTKHRAELYNHLKDTLSSNLTQGDLDIIIRLISYIFGDLTEQVYEIEKQVDPDKADEAYLRILSSVIGYEWNEALTAEQQREAIKLFVSIRQRRGSSWSIENLVRVFGQDSASFYSSSDLRGVRVVEYDPTDGNPDRNDLFPGDILLEIPQFSSILRDALEDIRLIGTRLIFAYLIHSGPFKTETIYSRVGDISLFFDPAYYGFDPIINDFGPEHAMTKLEDILDWPLGHRIKGAEQNLSTLIYTSITKPYDKGFVWAPVDTDNYMGILIDDETLKDDHVMYE